MTFRKDINGLRALSVLAVVLFHFQVPYLHGGFVGVDIFFVISGFLMTGIIFRRLKKDDFSIIGFYLDRGRRIIPALAVLCLVLLSLGYFWLIPFDYLALGKQAAAAATFVSNMLFFSEAGYFDHRSREKLLLHTWSLSVEWQFYIVYPLILLALKKILGVRLVRYALIILTLFSLALSVYIAPWDGPFAFFTLPTRAWEMSAGGLVYLFPIGGGGKGRQETNARSVRTDSYSGELALDA